MSLTVSILVPVYNASQYIGRCLNSIIQQYYEYKQIVVIDDGSNDDSFEICKKYAVEYPFVSVYTREHRGIVQTRKELLEYADGEYILFVDSDDWIERNMVSDMMQLIIDMNADIAMCGMYYGKRPIYPMDLTPKSGISIFNGLESLRIFLNEGRLMCSLCNKLIKRNLFEGLRYREDFLAGEDLFMMWQILPKVNTVVCTPAIYYHYENIAGSLTRSSEVFNTETSFMIWRELEKESEFNSAYDISKVRSILFYEAVSYAHALYKQENESAKSKINSLIPEFKKRLPYLKIRTRLHLLKALWGLSGVIAGYSFMKFIYKLSSNILKRARNYQKNIK